MTEQLLGYLAIKFPTPPGDYFAPRLPYFEILRDCPKVGEWPPQLVLAWCKAYFTLLYLHEFLNKSPQCELHKASIILLFVFASLALILALNMDNMQRVASFCCCVLAGTLGFLILVHFKLIHFPVWSPSWANTLNPLSKTLTELPY